MAASYSYSRVFSLPLSSGIISGPYPTGQATPLPPLFSEPLPLAGSTLSTRGQQGAVLVLGEKRGEGRLWEIFDAKVTTGPTRRDLSHPSLAPLAGLPTIAKLSSPMLFPFGFRPEATYTVEQARSAIAHEQRVMDRLSALQGSVVPVCGGTWGGTLLAGVEVEGRQAIWEIWVAVVEDCGQTVEMDDLSDEDKSVIISHYRAIHNAGIIHRDVECRHWLRHASGGIRIVDFDTALFIDELDPEEEAGWHEYWDAQDEAESAQGSCEEEGLSTMAESRRETLVEKYRAARVESEMRSVMRMLEME
ncbi:hypothetical protein IAT38_007048 [Cryptococcus sp. DSM 104549]